MDHELKALRRELGRRESGPGRRYAPELRARLAAWMAERRRSGASVATVAAELSLPEHTVRWLWPSAVSTERLLPVSVVVEAEAELVRVSSPSGFVVEGLTLEQAAALLRMLR
jgi:transposase-like protein